MLYLNSVVYENYHNVLMNITKSAVSVFNFVNTVMSHIAVTGRIQFIIQLALLHVVLSLTVSVPQLDSIV